jgi:DeoR/GlpR family transcriptional regulator of sugar metabolism
MLTHQRKQFILARLKTQGQIVATELSQELGLSEDTVRRDLRELAEQGLLQRVHGGALALSPAVGNFHARSSIQTSGKEAIGRAAAALVQNGQVVFVDGGTTCLQLARHLAPNLRATVVTHSPTIAVALVEHAHIEVVLIGGRLFKHSVVTVGAGALEAIAMVQADMYFMGVTGMHPRLGLCTGDLEEAHIKRRLMAQAAETWVLASAEKINTGSPYQIAPAKQATGAIVEKATPAKDLAAFKALGLSVVRAT